MTRIEAKCEFMLDSMGMSGVLKLYRKRVSGVLDRKGMAGMVDDTPLRWVVVLEKGVSILEHQALSEK